MTRESSVTSTEYMDLSGKIAAPENEVSGLFAPLAWTGRDEPGLVSLVRIRRLQEQ
jgi:hypothetical protein